MTYPVWVDDEWLEVSIPEMSGEGIVVPNVAAIVLSSDRKAMLLQRRDKPGEPVRGKLEVPGGRWRAGESPQEAIVREVHEEAGIDVVSLTGDSGSVVIGPHRSCGYALPLMVVNGLDGVYPSMHVVIECTGTGEPVGQPGETAEPAWWSLDDVRDLLGRDPDQFVDQTRSILSVYFEIA